MSELEEFRASVLPRLEEADTDPARKRYPRQRLNENFRTRW